MLYWGAYERLHPKPSVPRPDGRWYAPDFAQAPRSLSQAHQAWGITELKLPDAALLERRNAFHRGFSRAVHKGIDQLTNYRDLIESKDPKVVESLLRQLGGVPHRPRLAVVIGRRPEAAGDLADLRRRARDLPLHVEVITYDDVLDEEAQRILLQMSLGATL